MDRMKKKRNELLHMLTGFAKGSKRYFFIAVLGTALSILFSFLMPQVVGFTVDSVIGTKSAALPGFLMPLFEKAGGRDFLRVNFLLCAAGVMLCALLSGVFTYVSRINTSRGYGTLCQEAPRHTVYAHPIPAVFVAYREPDRRYHPALHL